MTADDLLEDYSTNPAPNFYYKLITIYYFNPNPTISMLI